MRIACGLLGTVLALTPVVALAQSDPATARAPVPPETPEKNVLEGNYLTIGGGAVIGPSYEGSDDYVVFPIPAIQGKIGGVAINPRSGGVALDFIPDPKGAKVGFALGPTATYSGNRDRHIVDPVVRAAGRLDADIAVGASGGVTLYRVLDGYDSLTASMDVKWDIHGPKGGMQVSPSLSYLTPLSKALVVALAVSAKHVNADYADYYYSVSPTQSFDSGLPLYRARAGWASVGATLVVGYSLSGDLRRGGFSLVGIAGYTRLLNDARDTPYTSIQGTPTQLVGGLGVAYTF